jgi:hypothetical protein
MKHGISERVLRENLRGLSTMPPGDGFDQRLRRSLAAASHEIRASRTPAAQAPVSRRTAVRTRVGLVVALGLAGLVVAAGLVARLYVAQAAARATGETSAGDHAGARVTR